MHDSDAAAISALIQQQPVAALATLHLPASATAAEPAVSMVPFAVLPGGALVIHVSRLASHTKDLFMHPTIALLVTAPLDENTSPLALPRLSIQGTATPCPQDAPLYEQARSTYLARFADAEELFNFSDFSLFVITPTSVRYVAGFGRAMSIGAERFGAIFQG
ncbi:MAG TPA: pyridoxamine 5'-phosphate oxidase family protein [Marinagarivorans sp.]|nr:pyridoxamine 5'-phosphate oxidase family protein [Marinagarivorans sp.]